jgi:hypothetical protein
MEVLLHHRRATSAASSSSLSPRPRVPTTSRPLPSSRVTQGRPKQKLGDEREYGEKSVRCRTPLFHTQIRKLQKDTIIGLRSYPLSQFVGEELETALVNSNILPAVWQPTRRPEAPRQQQKPTHLSPFPFQLTSSPTSSPASHLKSQTLARQAGRSLQLLSMRIRKNASRLLGSSNSVSAAHPFEPPTPAVSAPFMAPESLAGSSFSVLATASVETCELSRNPWDLIADLSISDPQVSTLHSSPSLPGFAAIPLPFALLEAHDSLARRFRRGVAASSSCSGHVLARVRRRVRVGRSSEWRRQEATTWPDSTCSELPLPRCNFGTVAWLCLESSKQLSN